MLFRLVRQHAQKSAEQTAVVAGTDRLTYQELDARVSAQARKLRESGVSPGDLVLIYLGRSADAVVALLAVMAAGACYCIMEPSVHGLSRLASIGADAVIASGADAQLARNQGMLTLEIGAPDADDLATEPTAIHEAADGETAYVLYTSGSTGVPKGVMVTHGNIQHYTESVLCRLAIDEPLAYAHVTTLAADLGNTSLFSALWTGGTFHLIDDYTRRDPGRLLEYLRSEQVHVLKTTPSHWAAVSRILTPVAGSSIGGFGRPNLRYLILGGELLRPSVARLAFSAGAAQCVVNHYGPTEATVGVAMHVLKDVSDCDALDPDGSVPIGTPIGSTRLFVRTPVGEFKERAAEGELYVAGPSVGLGYRNDAAATAAAFADDLTMRGVHVGRAYRTGDRVRANADGVFEFLGRSDRQVKIRGHRVELGHVEAGLRQVRGVANAWVAYLADDQRPRLIAAVTPTEEYQGLDKAGVRADLHTILPPYMMPDLIEVLAEFPRSANGKTDDAVLRLTVLQPDTSALGYKDTAEGIRGLDPWHGFDTGVDSIMEKVRLAWRRRLGHSNFGPSDRFEAIGGNSMDAIALIADLQGAGYRVSAADFLAEPTVAALADRLRAVRAEAAKSAGEGERGFARPEDDSTLSPAQAWFFRQGFAQPEQWNQALLLVIDGGVLLAPFAAAVADVVASHSLLHTAFVRSADGSVRRQKVEPPEVLTVSELPTDVADAEAHIRTIAETVQKQIDVESGSVIRVHLFHGEVASQLLLVCHHLCVDIASWHIILNDLSRCYERRLHGHGPAVAAWSEGFGVWTTHLRSQAANLHADLAHWCETPERISSARSVHAGLEVSAEDNLELDAEAVWFRLSQAETSLLAKAATDIRAALRSAVLAAFAATLAPSDGTASASIDVESHGRLSLDGAPEISGVVGWFTSTFPVTLEPACEKKEAVMRAAAAMDQVPHLGIAYGLHDRSEQAEACFNYIGAFDPPFGGDLRMSPSRIPIGPVRGPKNDRVYGLKLTGRLIDGQLVIDLSYSVRSYERERMIDIARAMHQWLLEAANLPVTKALLTVERGSSIGLIAQVPTEFSLECGGQAIREYEKVLITGATGFVGVHLLQLLLAETQSQIVCLVRPRDGMSAEQRLREAYSWYGLGDLGEYGSRLQVLAADVSGQGFSLGPDDYRTLNLEVDAIFHLAGDTRLFGPAEDFELSNVESVRGLIRLAETGRPKLLHHFSTLAVCGTGPAGSAAIFHEDTLTVGQSFLNDYERTKFEAERLVHEFIARGGSGFVYRLGNVTGHSLTGRFMRNAGDNRLVHVLQAVVALGRVPVESSESLTLSPVDTVVRGVFSIARCARIQGGTFHVDTDRHVSYVEIFAALRRLGYSLDPDPAPDIAALVRYSHGGAVSRGRFWTHRPARNVRYDHTRTLRLLDRLGVEFPELDGEWLDSFLGRLVSESKPFDVRETERLEMTSTQPDATPTA